MIKTTEGLRKKYTRYAKEMRAMAKERLKSCANVTELSKELGIDREVLYKWRARMEGRERRILARLGFSDPYAVAD